MVLSGTDGEIRAAVRAVSDADYRLQVTLPGGQVLGPDARRRAARRCDPQLRATEAHTLPDGRVVLDQPVVRPDGTAVVEHTSQRGGAGPRRLARPGVCWRSWPWCCSSCRWSSPTGWRGRSPRRSRDLAATTRRLAGGDLDARVEPAGPPEVHDVGLAVNRLAARIRELLAHERESVADLSHRLRTPVTALRLDVEGMPAGPDRDRLTADVDDLDRQVGALIRDARRPAGADAVAACDATEVVRERVEFWQALAEDQGRQRRPGAAGRHRARCAPRSPTSRRPSTHSSATSSRTRRTASGSTSASRRRPAAAGSLVVSDEGPGLPDATVVTRGRSGAGSTGLGLDIARRTAEVSGGSLTIGASPSGGACVTLRLGPPTT